ncbi:hypothetical protein C9374_014713 [Naegleria lovaniensis]|uniref:Uncharacterized protein n=1 Tax=Naegleria lovaniensis TaxID=51637 RepID=A0AA88GAD3_NAELO|nr:uncharacterized protein C9374_014713 [Naegleria lovaniensis]KAG2370650.1 hypothetical protein C9374_014713 [Naegleria lovaniensis]
MLLKIDFSNVNIQELITSNFDTVEIAFKIDRLPDGYYKSHNQCCMQLVSLQNSAVAQCRDLLFITNLSDGCIDIFNVHNMELLVTVYPDYFEESEGKLCCFIPKSTVASPTNHLGQNERGYMDSLYVCGCDFIEQLTFDIESMSYIDCPFNDRIRNILTNKLGAAMPRVVQKQSDLPNCIKVLTGITWSDKYELQLDLWQSEESEKSLTACIENTTSTYGHVFSKLDQVMSFTDRPNLVSEWKVIEERENDYEDTLLYEWCREFEDENPVFICVEPKFYVAVKLQKFENMSKAVEVVKEIFLFIFALSTIQNLFSACPFSSFLKDSLLLAQFLTSQNMEHLLYLENLRSILIYYGNLLKIGSCVDSKTRELNSQILSDCYTKLCKGERPSNPFFQKNLLPSTILPLIQKFTLETSNNISKKEKSLLLGMSGKFQFKPISTGQATFISRSEPKETMKVVIEIDGVQYDKRDLLVMYYYSCRNAEPKGILLTEGQYFSYDRHSLYRPYSSGF